MIVAIQSFTDVITNSSSEVFIMHQADANYYKQEYSSAVSIEKITMEWLRNNPEEVEAIFKVLKLDPSMITTYNDGYWSYWEAPDQDTWESFLNLYREKIEEAFRNLYWVDIDDYVDCIKNAIDDAEWSDSRH